VSLGPVGTMVQERATLTPPCLLSLQGLELVHCFLSAQRLFSHLYLGGSECEMRQTVLFFNKHPKSLDPTMQHPLHYYRVHVLHQDIRDVLLAVGTASPTDHPAILWMTEQLVVPNI
jgi:hypothetical protein